MLHASVHLSIRKNKAFRQLCSVYEENPKPGSDNFNKGKIVPNLKMTLNVRNGKTFYIHDL